MTVEANFFNTIISGEIDRLGGVPAGAAAPVDAEVDAEGVGAVGSMPRLMPMVDLADESGAEGVDLETSFIVSNLTAAAAATPADVEVAQLRELLAEKVLEVARLKEELQAEKGFLKWEQQKVVALRRKNAEVKEQNAKRGDDVAAVLRYFAKEDPKAIKALKKDKVILATLLAVNVLLFLSYEFLFPYFS